MDRDLQRMMYNGFFHELSEIQKEAGLFGQIASGAKTLWNKPELARKALGMTYRAGAQGAAAKGAGRIGQVASGVRQALNTTPGKALAAGAVGAGALGAGAMGTGYMAGRAR